MRIEQNLQVINAIAQKNFNPEILERYTGYGGIGRELAEYDYYKKLNSVIPKQKIAEIKATTKTAYYTPELLIKFIYQALDKLGFKSGNILETSAGTGAFIKHMPKTMKENSKILAIETEPVAHSILKALHPDILLRLTLFGIICPILNAYYAKLFDIKYLASLELRHGSAQLNI